MAFNYTNLQATASKLLANFSQGAVELVRSNGVVAGVNEWDLPTDNTPTTYTLDAVVEGVNKSLVDGVNILASDLKVTFAAFQISPSVNDKINIDGNSKTIVSLTAIPSAGVVCAWEAIVR